MHRRDLTADVFPDRAFVGDPLAIVLEVAGPSTAQTQRFMQRSWRGSGSDERWTTTASC